MENEYSAITLGDQTLKIDNVHSYLSPHMSLLIYLFLHFYYFFFAKLG